MPEALYRRMVLGQWAAASGAVYPQFDVSTHIRQIVPDPHWKYYVGIDFGYTNPFCALLVGVDYDDTYYVLGEHYAPGLLTDEHARDIKAMIGDLEVTEILADPAGKQALVELEASLGMNVSPGLNAVQFGIGRIRGLLSDRGDGKVRLFVDPKCVNLIRELQGYEYDKGEQPVKTDDHACDALRYVVATLEWEKQ
jgi:phage terminase large subunit